MDRSKPLASIRPYLVRAWHEWCVDQNLTPYLTVAVDGSVQVPPEYVKEGKIVLNIAPDAVSGLLIGNEVLKFQARFAGVVRPISVPVGRILSVHVRENGQGMFFGPPEEPATDASQFHTPSSSAGPRQWPSDLHSMPGVLMVDEREELLGRYLQSVQQKELTDPPTSPKGRPAIRRIK